MTSSWNAYTGDKLTWDGQKLYANTGATALLTVATREIRGGHSIKVGTKLLKKQVPPSTATVQTTGYKLTDSVLWTQQQSHTQINRQTHKQKQAVNCDSKSTRSIDKLKVKSATSNPKS